MQLHNRTYIVSGGASGLGEATTKLLLSNGAYVSILDLNPPKSLSKDEESRSLFTTTNVASTESLETAVKNTIQWTLKTSAPLSGVCTCAGVPGAALALPKQSPDATHDTVKYYDIKHFDKVMAINLRGTADLVRLTIPHMALNKPLGEDGERGVVILVASAAAYEGQVGQLAYSASKGAVASIVLPLARELGQKAGIRVVGIAPGLFQTAMTSPPQPKAKSDAAPAVAKAKSKHSGISPEMVQYPMRMGHGHEFARLVKEIVENPMLNGSVIRLDGGVRMPSRLWASKNATEVPIVGKYIRLGLDGAATGVWTPYIGGNEYGYQDYGLQKWRMVRACHTDEPAFAIHRHQNVWEMIVDLP